MGVTGFFMALNEVNIDGGVLRWTVLLLCSMLYQYDVEARIILEDYGEKQSNGVIGTVSGAYSKQLRSWREGAATLL